MEFGLKCGPYDSDVIFPGLFKFPENRNRNRGFGIDSRIVGAASRAPAASREDFPPQAILKLHRPSSLDYRPRHGLTIFPKLTCTLNKACPSSLDYRARHGRSVNGGYFVNTPFCIKIKACSQFRKMYEVVVCQNVC